MSARKEIIEFIRGLTPEEADAIHSFLTAKQQHFTTERNGTVKKEFFTDAQVEAEIERLLNSDAVKLAKKETQIKNRRRQYMYQLRSMEKRGKQLEAEGITVATLEGWLSKAETE